jgi:hypothetical protein
VFIQRALGVALIIAETGLFVRAYLRLAERARHRDGRRDADPPGPPVLDVRRYRLSRSARSADSSSASPPSVRVHGSSLR